MNEYQVHLARINCVLDQAAMELDREEYYEFLAAVESELLERLETSEDTGADENDDESNDEENSDEELDGGGQEEAG